MSGQRETFMQGYNRRWDLRLAVFCAAVAVLAFAKGDVGTGIVLLVIAVLSFLLWTRALRRRRPEVREPLPPFRRRP
jgi:membrane protein implicated in regulation of membrane protease activity